ncbi:immune inhibitor A domain-containing protein [Nonomuraea soli]|uniref:Immune inhibitor A n=1 Tax=Nonomuraea soli TaxID=1032476 RepID=A0A7W0CPK1_9ACTN|nr:immune inhibitor A domain-containing protein [Nonomuraea soli]MBA2894854.1 immune inhibitor A [Nonomuraea soli]
MQHAAAADYRPAPRDHYLNYSPPRDEPKTTDKPVPQREESFPSTGSPAAARVLAAHEQEALRTGRDPAQLKVKRPKRGKLLTILVEFDQGAQDDFSGFERPRSASGEPWDCVTEPAGTVKNGPLHNRIPDPAATGKDNNSFWVKDFSPQHYRQQLYSTTGLTQRVRTDLRDPRDGRKGIDVRGSLRRYYEDVSGGAYSVTGDVAGWVRAPHSEAWYGASACGRPVQDNAGHPDNPRGPAQLVIDAVTALGPSFPWKNYDLEDVTDADGDQNFAEPDGVIDHLTIVHAGRDKSTGGGAEGTYALWAHSSTVAGGFEIPGAGKRVSTYMMVPEDAGVGLFAHEYGHDLGLPDLYDTTNTTTASVEFWDLMASGSHTGPLYQSMPTRLSLWCRWVLGWASPKTFEPGARQGLHVLGRQGMRINLPAEKQAMVTPHSGKRTWWSGQGQDWAEATLTRQISVPAQAPRLWMWNNYEIDFGRDHGYVEVSADSGKSWTRQRVFDSEGEEVTYDLALTGQSFDWQHHYVDLAPYAGRTVRVRLVYVTDGADTQRGWHVDDFSVTSGQSTVWSDDVESGSSWTPAGRGRWSLNDGTREIQRMYLAEWRTDPGLRYAYTTKDSGGWQVERFRYNAPGLLVWLRDSAYTGNVLIPSLDRLPSIGPKGALLLVDSHFEPLRGADGVNLPGRVQVGNAAFTTGKNGVATFTDAKTWYPGFEARDGLLHYRDLDASVVIPARGQYGTRVVKPDGSPAKEFYGTDLGNGHKLGTGDPGSLAYGVRVQLAGPLLANTALVRITPSGK